MIKTISTQVAMLRDAPWSRDQRDPGVKFILYDISIKAFMLCCNVDLCMPLSFKSEIASASSSKVSENPVNSFPSMKAAIGSTSLSSSSTFTDPLLTALHEGRLVPKMLALCLNASRQTSCASSMCVASSSRIDVAFFSHSVHGVLP